MRTVAIGRVAGAIVCGSVMTIIALAAQTPPGQSTPPAAPQQSMAQGTGACTPATDPEYGLVVNKAVQIGGGALYMAARERRYLDSLKGPGGQTLTYKRVGSTGLKPNDSRPIDMWEVTWEGAPKPITIFLFAYMYGEPKVPAGFTCSGFTLGNPPIDGFISRDQRTIVAVTQGATQDFAPVSLDVDGSAKSGIIFDRFRMLARASRAATADGKPLDPAKLPPEFNQPGLIVVAYPTMCGEKPASPKTIDLGTQTGGVQKSRPYLTGADLESLLPGVKLPAGSAAAVMQVDALRPNDAIRVIYDEALCDEKTRTIVYPLRGAGAKGNVMPEPTLGEGMTPPSEPVWLQAVVDLEGRLLNAQHVGGPGGAYVERALATLKDWKAEPARINGSPVVADTHVVFAFKK
jgi:hypothetical protein